MKIWMFTGMAVAAATAPLSADVVTSQPAPKEMELLQGDPETKGLAISHEVESEVSYVFGAETRRGNIEFGDLDEIHAKFDYTATVGVTEKAHLRVGPSWERFSFGLPEGAPLPNTLQATALKLGVDYDLNDKWILRFEVSPGVYSDFGDISGEDVNAPGLLGFSYLYSDELQWFFGLAFDPWNEYPVLPGFGVRWEFAKDWTLMLVLPKPRLEYKPIEPLTLYVGGELLSGSYRVNHDLGTPKGLAKLDNAIVSYREIRVGGGVKYDILPNLSAEAEGGYMVDREFDFWDEGTRVDTDGAPYVKLGLSASF